MTPCRVCIEPTMNSEGLCWVCRGWLSMGGIARFWHRYRWQIEPEAKPWEPGPMVVVYVQYEPPAELCRN